MGIGNMRDLDLVDPRLKLQDALAQRILDIASALGDPADDLGEVGDAVGGARLGHAGAAIEDAPQVFADGVAESVGVMTRMLIKERGGFGSKSVE